MVEGTFLHSLRAHHERLRGGRGRTAHQSLKARGIFSIAAEVASVAAAENAKLDAARAITVPDTAHATMQSSMALDVKEAALS